MNTDPAVVTIHTQQWERGIAHVVRSDMWGIEDVTSQVADDGSGNEIVTLHTGLDGHESYELHLNRAAIDRILDAVHARPSGSVKTDEDEEVSVFRHIFSIEVPIGISPNDLNEMLCEAIQERKEGPLWDLSQIVTDISQGA